MPYSSCGYDVHDMICTHLDYTLFQLSLPLDVFNFNVNTFGKDTSSLVQNQICKNINYEKVNIYFKSLF